jgi:hypothetical protein
MGQESLEDDARSGRPVEVFTDDNIVLVEELVVHDHLGMHKVSGRWVPKHLSAVQRQHRVECAIVHEHI